MMGSINGDRENSHYLYIFCNQSQQEITMDEKFKKNI